VRCTQENPLLRCSHLCASFWITFRLKLTTEPSKLTHYDIILCINNSMLRKHNTFQLYVNNLNHNSIIINTSNNMVYIFLSHQEVVTSGAVAVHWSYCLLLWTWMLHPHCQRGFKATYFGLGFGLTVIACSWPHEVQALFLCSLAECVFHKVVLSWNWTVLQCQDTLL